MPGTAEAASEQIRGSLVALVDATLERQRQRWPGLGDSLSPSQREHMVEDTRFHLEFIASALWFEEPSLLDDYAIWCKVLFTNLDLPLEWLSGSFKCIAETLDASLPDDQATLARTYIEGALVVLAQASTETTSFIEPGSALGNLAGSYLRAALEGRRFDAVQMLVDAVESGTPVRDIYLQVFQPTQHEIGRLWQLNQISVAREHYVTAVTQTAMARLYEYVFAEPASGRILVVACVGGELHELGARMVADFFEMNRWDTHYLGANTPATAILEIVRKTDADILALSATMTFHVDEIAEVIRLLRSDPSTTSTKVLVGGYPFNATPDLWRRVGADASAPSAGSALAAAEALVAAPDQGDGS